MSLFRGQRRSFYMMQHAVQPLLDFIAASPSCYHVIANTAAELTAAG